MTSQNKEVHRKKWAKLAKENGWYTEPFYIHIFKNEDGKIVDSVAHRDMTDDLLTITNAY